MVPTYPRRLGHFRNRCPHRSVTGGAPHVSRVQRLHAGGNRYPVVDGLRWHTPRYDARIRCRLITAAAGYWTSTGRNRHDRAQVRPAPRRRGRVPRPTPAPRCPPALDARRSGPEPPLRGRRLLLLWCRCSKSPSRRKLWCGPCRPRQEEAPDRPRGVSGRSGEEAPRHRPPPRAFAVAVCPSPFPR
jgi:hypothetical protein